MSYSMSSWQVGVSTAFAESGERKACSLACCIAACAEAQ